MLSTQSTKLPKLTPLVTMCQGLCPDCFHNWKTILVLGDKGWDFPECLRACLHWGGSPDTLSHSHLLSPSHKLQTQKHAPEVTLGLSSPFTCQPHRRPKCFCKYQGCIWNPLSSNQAPQKPLNQSSLNSKCPRPAPLSWLIIETV